MPTKKEQNVLHRILGMAKWLLSKILRQRDLFHKEFERILPKVLPPEVKTSLEQAQRDVTRGSINWPNLESVGLTGSQLDFKYDFLRVDVKRGLVGSILTCLKSLMHSASKAFPYLMIVKEFIEIVEASIQNLNARIK